MTILRKLKPNPTKFKKAFQEHNIPASRIAPYLGFSYPYTLNLLNGVDKMTSKVEHKLQALLDELEAEVAK